MLTERQMITLPAPIVNKFISLETDVIKMIASRIKAIAELDTEDSYKLAIIKNIDNDLEYINNQLNDILAGIKDEIHEIYSKAIESEYNDFLSDIAEKIVLLLPLISVLPFANIIAIVSSIISTSALPFRRKSSEMPLDTRSMLQRIKDRVFPPGIEEEPTVEKRSIFQRLRDFIFPFRRNDEIQTAINIVTDETTNHIKNITETIGFLNVNNEFKSLHEFYVDILNKAVTNIYEGKETFYNEMRKTIRIIADRGLTHVEYESGRRLRLDTAVRTALNGGRSRLALEAARINGEKFGADGMEISWHSAPRPSHEFMGGQQYNMGTFNRDIVPFLMEANCYHHAFPIILGISMPIFTQEEIKEMNAKDRELMRYGDKTYTKYEAVQVQRKIEAAIRREKDRVTAFKAAGDDEAAKIARAKARVLNNQYKTFSQALGLDMYPQRTAGVL